VCNVTPFDIQFAPIKVSDVCQAVLFREVPKILLTSGSINYKTGELLGITDDDCTIDEYPHTFPLESRIVYLLKGARMNAKSDGESIQDWLWAADSIIKDRLDRKGIFHTTSYSRRDFVMAHSQYKHHMMSHHKRDVLQMVDEFKSAKAPKVFVSPSVTTGWDFPYQACEFQILGKVPYPDSRNVITAARNEVDPEYGAYIAMQQIVQACGRGTRAEDDHCENFIIDDNFGGWFLKRYGKFAPKWFRDSLTRRMFAPEPPTSLNRR
jgi:Rad3-related DNA helicase